MAKYVITIEDQDGAVAVLMAGPKKTDGGAAAGYLAHELMRAAPEILSQAAQDICNCGKCQAARAAQAGTNQTIH